MRRFIGPLLMGLGIGLCWIFPAKAGAAQPAQPGNPAAVRAYARVLQKLNPHMPAWQSRSLAQHLLINSVRWKVDANILVALVSVESAWRTGARSWVGAVGLGQLMPGTARLMHVDARDPYQNLQGAARYLGGLLHRYRNSSQQYALAFAAYNAGPRAVSQFGGIPPYAETENYVIKVMQAWQHVQRVVHIPRMRRAPLILTYGSPDVSYWTTR